MPISRSVEPSDIGVMPPRRRPEPDMAPEPQVERVSEPDQDVPPEKPVRRGKK